MGETPAQFYARQEPKLIPPTPEQFQEMEKTVEKICYPNGRKLTFAGQTTYPCETIKIKFFHGQVLEVGPDLALQSLKRGAAKIVEGQ